MKRLDSEEALKALALDYLQRFPTTTERMRKYLSQKLKVAVADGVVRPSVVKPWIDSVIAVLIRTRLLDDAVYAELRARTLHNRGRATRFIARDLVQKKADATAIERAVVTLHDEVPDADLVAAIRLAKKKKLGPFFEGTLKSKPGEHERDAKVRLRNKHLGALARSGFGFEIARVVLDARSAHELEGMIR